MGARCSVRGGQACGWTGRGSDSARVPPRWDRVLGGQIPVLSEVKAIRRGKKKSVQAWDQHGHTIPNCCTHL